MAQRELNRMINDALFGTAQTSAVQTDPQPTLTLDGLMYQLAVWNQDLEEEPIAVAMRAEPGTIALLERHLPRQQSNDVFGAMGGIRIEEDDTLPPRRVDFVDHRGRIIKRVEIR